MQFNAQQLQHKSGLKLYYQFAFPFEHLWAWLNSCRHEESVRREFAFVSSNNRFQRDLRFATHHEWQNAMLLHVPVRVEVGPQWNTLCTAGLEYAGLRCATSTMQGQGHGVSSQEMSNIFSQGIRSTEWNQKLDAMRESVGFHDIAPVHESVIMMPISNATSHSQSSASASAEPNTMSEAKGKVLVQRTLEETFGKSSRSSSPSENPIQSLASAQPRVKIMDDAIQRWPLRRELIFDIDINDYDDVRTCCNGPRACTRCWDIIWAAVVVLNAFLKQQCDMCHVLWVYSGRRGVHCWISDQDVIDMSSPQRRIMISMMQVVPPIAQRTLMQSYQDSHYLRLHVNPWANSALHALMPVFTKFWIESINASKLPEFESFLDSRVRAAFRTRIVPTSSSSTNSTGDTTEHNARGARWREFVLQHSLFVKSTKHMQQGGAQSVPDVLHRIVFSCLYPRLDVPVTVQMNHLLKLPFCIHPATFQVCLPFETMRRDQVMSILQAPKLADIVDCIQHKNRLPYAFRRAVNLLHIKAAMIHVCAKNQMDRGTIRKAVRPLVIPIHELPELAAFGDLRLNTF